MVEKASHFEVPIYNKMRDDLKQELEKELDKFMDAIELQLKQKHVEDVKRINAECEGNIRELGKKLEDLFFNGADNIAIKNKRDKIKAANWEQERKQQNRQQEMDREIAKLRDGNFFEESVYLFFG